MAKGQGMPINVIVIAVIALLVLLILALIFSGYLGQWRGKISQPCDTDKIIGYKCASSCDPVTKLHPTGTCTTAGEYCCKTP